MFFSFCDSFCCCLYQLRHCFHDTQDSLHTRNRDVESRLRPASFGVYPSFADTMKDYSRSVHEQSGPSAAVPSSFQQDGLSESSRGMASGLTSDYIGSVSDLMSQLNVV